MTEPILKLPFKTKRTGRSGRTRIIVDSGNLCYGSFDSETARELVRRINAFDKMFEALKAVLKYDEENHTDVMDWAHTKDAATQALELATKDTV